MGNLFRSHFAHIVVGILLFALTVLMAACTVEQPGRLSFPELPELEVFLPQPQARRTPVLNPGGVGGPPFNRGNIPETTS